jgi:hypothetical protein
MSMSRGFAHNVHDFVIMEGTVTYYAFGIVGMKIGVIGLLVETGDK